MPVKIFFPRIPDAEVEFIKLLNQVCPSLVNSAKMLKNPEGRPFCIMPVNYSESNGKSANDIIDAMSGKMVADVILKPRIYIDSAILKQLDNPRLVQKEIEDDVVNITHYYHDHYYLQLKSDKDRNRMVRDSLRTLYEEFRSNMLTVLEFEELSIGQLYATVFMNDGELYRVKLLEKCVGDKIKVYFIDFGNTEVIESFPILGIGEELANFPPLAHKCVIDNVRIVDEKKHDIVSREVIDRTYKAKLKKTINDDGFECATSVDFLNFTSVSYRSYLILENIAIDLDIDDSQRQKSNKNDVYLFENGVKENVEMAVMTHIESLENFYVQQASKKVDDYLSEIVRLTDYLTSRLKDNLRYIDDDTIYLTKFTDDCNWYRSKVIDNKWDDIGQSYCVVQFIDFGNTEKKYNQKDLKPLTKEWCEQAYELSLFPSCAHNCSFSKILVNGLLDSKVDVPYLSKEMVATEKIVKLCFFDDDKVWIVNNIIVEGEVDFLTKYCPSHRRDSLQLSSSDLYRLSNMESINKIWLQLVSSSDQDRNKQLQCLKKWNISKMSNDIKSVTSVSLDRLYCAVNKHGHLFRCRVTGKNIDRVIVQFVDSGIHEVIKLTSLYPLPSNIAAIAPISKAYKLALKVHPGREDEVEKKIVKFLQHSDVELNFLSDSVVKDIIIKEKSLIESLAEYDDTDKDDKYKDLPECLLPPITEEGDVDFSLPSVDKMNEVPLDIAVENCRMRFLRKIFHITSEEKCIFDYIWEIVENCEPLEEILKCCQEVENIVIEMDLIKVNMCSIVMNRASKYRDLLPLLEKRKSVCDTICEVYESLQTLLAKTTVSDHQILKVKIMRLLSGISSILDIIQLNASATTNITNIYELKERIILFYQSTLYKDNILPEILKSTQNTDAAAHKLRDVLESMIKDYDLQDTIASISNTTVPLVDVTYALHSSIKTENSLIIKDILNNSDVFISQAFIECHCFLESKKAALDTILARTIKLQSLQEHALSIIAEDIEVIQMIENTHKKILTNRSALRHAVPDLEDAEELDLKDRQQELTIKIRDLRKSLQGDLKSSMDIINSDIRELMLKKPELQLKNQSIFFHDRGMPIFLWDAIYFDMSQETCSSDYYVDSTFVDEKVKIRKISMSKEHYKATLGDISICSSTLASINQEYVGITPILFAFMSKSGHIALYVVVPHFMKVTTLPPHISKSVFNTITFFKHSIDQLLVLWHLGYVYTDDDLKNGIFYTCQHEEPDKTALCLPLPLSSIIHRDKLGRDKLEDGSINISMRKLGSLFKETLLQCNRELQWTDEDENVLTQLVTVVTNCGEVGEAETVSEELKQFVEKMTEELSEREIKSCENRNLDGEDEDMGGSSSISGHGSSIEQVKDDVEETDYIAKEIEVETAENIVEVNTAVSEQVLETYSEFE